MPKKSAPSTSQIKKTPLAKRGKKSTLQKTESRIVEAEIVEAPNTLNSTDLSREGLQPLATDHDAEFEIPHSDVVSELESDLDTEIDPEVIVKKTKKSLSNLPATTNRDLKSTDPLVLYLQEIRKYPLLTREEEMSLAQKYFEGKDPKIAQKLVQSNLRFVVKIAAEYSKFGTKMIDLIQEGNVGLMHAVRDFNPYKGARLITYAVWWIRGYIQEYLMRQYSMVRIGTTQNQRKLFYQLQKHKEILSSAQSAEQIKALSEELNIPADEITTMAQRLFSRDTSLDRKIDDDSNSTILDMQRTDEEEPLDDLLARLEQLELLKEKIQDIRPELSEKETILLDERILNDQPLTLQEIGEKYGITREAVRQTEARLIKKIKEKMLGRHEDN